MFPRIVLYADNGKMELSSLEPSPSPNALFYVFLGPSYRSRAHCFQPSLQIQQSFQKPILMYREQPSDKLLHKATIPHI